MKIFRTLVIVLAAFLAAYLVPARLPISLSGSFGLPAAVVFAALFGMLSFIAIDRRERLKEAVATELNKIRRVYHLGKNLGNAPHLRGWFTDLHGFVYDYLGGFEKYDLSQYEKGNALFRRVAYHIYTVPDLREVKEQVLYDELLTATSIVSDARQKISTLLKSSYAASHWFELAAAAVIFAATVLATAADASVPRFVAGAVISLGAILATTFFEHDLWVGSSNRALAMEYVKNIARLELRRG